MAEEETVHAFRHFGRYRIGQFIRCLGSVDPVLQFRFSGQSFRDVSSVFIPQSQSLRVAVKLVSSANKYMKRLLRVIPKQVKPHWVITAPIPWTPKVILIDACAKPVAL